MNTLQHSIAGPSVSLPVLSEAQRAALQLLKEGSAALPAPLPLQAHLILDRNINDHDFLVHLSLGRHIVGHVDISVHRKDDVLTNRRGCFALLDWGFIKHGSRGSPCLEKMEPLAAISVDPEIRYSHRGTGEALLAIGTRIARELGAEYLRISHVLPIARGFFARYSHSISQHMEWFEDEGKNMPVGDFYIHLNGASLPRISIEAQK